MPSEGMEQELDLELELRLKLEEGPKVNCRTLHTPDFVTMGLSALQLRCA